MTTYSDYMYFTGECREDERDEEEGAARGNTTLVRPIIVGVDMKNGRSTRTPSEMEGCSDPWIATRIAADIEEM